MVTRVVADEIGLRLDELAARATGSEQGGIVEAILAANPGLAALGPVLPLGTVVVVPDVVPAEPTAGLARVVNPWD